MKKLLVIAFTLAALRAVAADITLQGTIGKYPVVMNISTDDDGTCNAKYFYTSALHDIYLEGKATNTTFSFSAETYDASGKSTGTERFSLTEGAKHNFTGTWKSGKGKVLPVALHPAVAGAAKNPFLKYSAVHEADDYDLLRSAEMKIIKDSTGKRGPYTLSYIHIAHSQVGIMQFTTGPDMPALNKINDMLMEKFITYTMQDFSCEVDNYYFTGPFIRSNVFSTDIFTSYYCNGTAHPDFGDDAVNINLRTGKEMKLGDVLYISDVAEPDEKKEYDAWSNYRKKVLAPKIMDLLRALHPAEMKTAQEDDTSCNYNTPDVWEFAPWFFTDTGLYISPDFPHVAGPCRNPDWSLIPYTEMKKYRKPRSGIDLSE